MCEEGTAKKEPPDWIFDNIAEASKKARRIYTIYVSLRAYCGITVVSTTDLQLVLNLPARLPIINIEVSLEGFYLIAPILCILTFVYLQLYLHRIKGLITQLKTTYDFREHRRTYP